MPGTNLSTGTSAWARLGGRVGDVLRRWASTFGQQPALGHSADIDAYVLLSRLRRQRAASGQRSIVIPLPGCIDDAQTNLRITM